MKTRDYGDPCTYNEATSRRESETQAPRQGQCVPKRDHVRPRRQGTDRPFRWRTAERHSGAEAVAPQDSEIARLPEHTRKAFVVTLKQLDRLQSSEPVTSEFLKGQGCIPGSATAVKIVGTGTLTKKLTIQGCGASASARAAIEKAGGSVTG